VSQSQRQIIRDHGRNHRKGGTDPIGTFIEYGVENDGSFLHVDTETGSIRFTANGAWGATLESPGGPVTLRGDAVEITDTAGGGTTIDPEGPIDIRSQDSSITFNSDDQIAFNPGLDMIVKLNSGQKFQIIDSSENPIFEVRENGTIHGKTGSGPVVFDL